MATPTNDKFNQALLKLAHDIALIAVTLMLVQVFSGLALALPSSYDGMCVPVTVGGLIYMFSKEGKTRLVGGLIMLGSTLVLFAIMHNLGMWGG